MSVGAVAGLTGESCHLRQQSVVPRRVEAGDITARLDLAPHELLVEEFFRIEEGRVPPDQGEVVRLAGRLQYVVEGAGRNRLDFDVDTDLGQVLLDDLRHRDVGPTVRGVEDGLAASQVPSCERTRSP